MPIYAFRCSQCNQLTSRFSRKFEPPTSVQCEGCGNPETIRLLSSFAFHRSIDSKLSYLDPKYDKLVDEAMKKTSESDPQKHLDRMIPFDVADE